MDKFAYIVFKNTSNGVDSWHNVHSVWLTKDQAEIAEITANLNNKDPEYIEYYVQEIEIGVEQT